MLITTTHSIEGRKTTHYLGLVTGETIIGSNIFKDIFASIRDVVGGRVGSYEKDLRSARDAALEEMRHRAGELGADAVVGVDLDYEVLSGGQGGNMLMVSISGTAVKLS